MGRGAAAGAELRAAGGKVEYKDTPTDFYRSSERKRENLVLEVYTVGLRTCARMATVIDTIEGMMGS